MTVKKRKNELEFLQNCQLLFTNFYKVEEIAKKMEEYGYNEEIISQGNLLYQKAEEYYQQTQKKRSEKRKSHQIFMQEFDDFWNKYRKHRKILKVALTKQAKYWVFFKIDTALPHSYLEKMEYMRIFYEGLQNPNQEIQPSLKRFKLTPDVAQQGVVTYEKTEKLRSNYEKNRGESQQMTQDKKRTFEQLYEWINDFYKVAQIALEEHPQLLESIGIFVRS